MRLGSPRLTAAAVQESASWLMLA